MTQTESDPETLLRFEHVPTYEEFFTKCLLPNRPCILPKELISDWPVIRGNWWKKAKDQSNDTLTTHCSSSEDQVNWDRLSQDYGSHTAPVVISSSSFNDHQKQEEEEEEMIEMSIQDAISRIKSKPDKTTIYIKDWHLIRQLDSSSSSSSSCSVPYKVVSIFSDDWMNNVTEEQDDFRFCYAGTKGSRTRIHRDVYTSYSWSTNLIGDKRWILFPPSVCHYLRQFPEISTSRLLDSLDSPIASSWKTKTKVKEKSIIIIQKQGETIFVPSNWYHQVNNLSDCISINRNWCNSFNIESMYQSIEEEIQNVENSLIDVKQILQQQAKKNNDDENWKKEFTQIVQQVAIQDAGWAWKGFWEMIDRNLSHPCTISCYRPSDTFVREKLFPLIERFQKRYDYRFLQEEIQQIAEKCRQQIMQL